MNKRGRGTGGGLALGLLGVGALLGAGIGYLAGPTVPVVGRLPLETVASFGMVLGEFQQALVGGVAERAGAFFWGGAVLFGAVGFGVGRAISGRG